MPSNDTPEQSTAKKNPLGPTGETVRRNIKRHRERLNLTYAELSRRLDRIGRAIPVLGLSRIEAGGRRVDADDLVALAIALGVNPNALLLPPTNDSEHTVVITGGPMENAADVWAWGNGKRPLPRHWPKVDPNAPAGGRAAYAQAAFEANTNPAIQDWTDQPNIMVGIQADDNGDD
ncbi:helix-turn-helix domain-containing protein [Nocardia farcinica]